MTNIVMPDKIRRMKRVNISVLKAELSAHIQLVRAGEEVLVCDRNEPVARIIPCYANDYSEQQLRLIARGTVLPPRKKVPGPKTAPWPVPPGDVSDEAVKQLWQQEREGR